LVHANIKLLADHLGLAYPVVDADAMIDAVFVVAAARLRSVPATRPDLWLLGIAREMLEHGPDRGVWQLRNAEVVVQSMRGLADDMDDLDLWASTDLIVRLIEQLPVEDQEVLRLATCIHDLDGGALATILGVSEQSASEALARVLETFRLAYNIASIGEGSTGGEL